MLAPVSKLTALCELAMPTNFHVDIFELEAYCRRWQVSELALFGSILRDDFGPDSDIDVLVSFLPDAGHGFGDLVDMEEELTTMFGRKVDLVERAAVEQSRNYLRRRAVLGDLRTLYRAA